MSAIVGRAENICSYRGLLSLTPERTCGLRAACRILPPAPLHLIIVLAAAPTPIASLGVPIGLEKGSHADVAPAVAARNGDIRRRPAGHTAALRLGAQHRD